MSRINSKFRMMDLQVWLSDGMKTSSESQSSRCKEKYQQEVLKDEPCGRQGLIVLASDCERRRTMFTDFLRILILENCISLTRNADFLYLKSAGA